MSVSRERHWFERTANDVAVQRGFQLLAGAKVVALQHLLDASVEPLDYAVGLGVLRRGQAVFDAKVAAQQIERVLAGGRALAQAEQAVGELAAARHWARTNGAVNGSLGQHRSDVDRAGPFEIT